MKFDSSLAKADSPNIGASRPTKYELRTFRVEANAAHVECSERGVHGSSPVPLSLPESLYSEEQMAVLHEAFALLEEGFRSVHDEKEEELGLLGIALPRAEVQKLVLAAENAKAEAARLESANASAASELLRKQKAVAELDVLIAERAGTLEASGSSTRVDAGG